MLNKCKTRKKEIIPYFIGSKRILAGSYCVIKADESLKIRLF